MPRFLTSTTVELQEPVQSDYQHSRIGLECWNWYPLLAALSAPTIELISGL